LIEHFDALDILFDRTNCNTEIKNSKAGHVLKSYISCVNNSILLRLFYEVDH